GQGGKGSSRIGDRFSPPRLTGERHAGRALARIGIEHVAQTARRSLDDFAADEMTDFTHPRVSLDRGRRHPPMGPYLAVFLASGHEAPPKADSWRRPARCFNALQASS